MSVSAQNQTSVEWKSFFSKTSAGPSVIERVHGYRDAGTYADEFLMVFKWLLLPISVAVTSLFQFALVYHLALPFLGHGWSVFSAAVFSLFLEVAKIWLGIQLWRSVFFGALRWGIASMSMLFASFLIAAAAFYWSFSNSTDGTQYITNYIAHYKVERDSTALEAVVAPIDAAGTAASTAAALDRGARKTAFNLSRVQLEQEKQRSALIEAELAKKQELDARRNGFIDRVSGFFKTMGGKMEILQILILFGLVLCERTLYDRLKAVETGNGGGDGGKGTPLPRQHGKQPGQNLQHFNGNGHKTETLWTAQDENTVPQMRVSMAQHNGGAGVIGCDEILDRCKTAIQRDLGNFDDKYAKKTSVSARINLALDNCMVAMAHSQFAPSQAKGAGFYHYLAEKVFPSLEGRGYPYPNADGFIERLLAVIPRETAAA